IFKPDPARPWSGPFVKELVLKEIGDLAAYEEQRLALMERLKQLPLGDLNGAPLTALAPGKPFGVLPLDPQKHRELSCSQFRVECKHDDLGAVRLLCLGEKDVQSTAPVAGIRVRHLSWGGEKFSIARHLPQLAQARAGKFYLDRF